MTPPPLLDCPKLAPKVYPPPLWNFQNFSTPPGNIAVSYEGERLVVLFTKMPNVLSFMYFLLNYITDMKVNSL